MSGLLRSFLAASVVSVVTACGTNPEPTTFVCTDFRPGADLSKTDFSAPKEIAATYGALAQAAADVSVVSASLVIHAQAACDDLARALGASTSDARLKAPRDRTGVKDTCALAAERVAVARTTLAAAGIVIAPVSPRCPVDASLQESCEARCKVDPSCVDPPVEVRCAEEDREATCSGTCQGPCVGTELAPAKCEGTCTGTCFGACETSKSGKGSGSGDDDDDAKACEGTGCVCKGTCKGTCTATCTPREGKGFACDGACRAGCTGTVANTKCTGALAPPTCAGDADCQTACEASAAARAACEPAGVAVAVSDPGKIDANLARMVSALQRDIPILVVADSEHAKEMKAKAGTLVDAAGRILTRTESLGTEAAACGLVMAQAGTDAKDDLGAVTAAAQKVLAALTPPPAPPAPTP